METRLVEGAATPPVPMTGSERSLAPDIARGLLLMFIAIANIPGFHVGYTGREPEGSLLDRVVAGFEAAFVHDRSRPMFAVLFGFGLAVMASRMAARGIDRKGIRRVLRRRSLWLMLFGMVHAALLWSGDILALYGATALVALFLVDRSARVLRRWFWVSVVTMSVGWVAIFWQFGVNRGAEAIPQMDSYPRFMLIGLVQSVFLQLLSVVFLLFLPLVIVGFGLYRAGWLTTPQDHLPELRRVFVTTMAANVVLSVPAVLWELDIWQLDGGWLAVGTAFEILVGAATGVGYVCGFALLAARWAHRGRTGLPGMLAAVGERSMTAYLAQSVLFFTIVTGFGFGLGAQLGTAGDTLTAIAVWTVIMFGMAGLARLGLRGPFEVLTRRLTYHGRSWTGRRARAGEG